MKTGLASILVFALLGSLVAGLQADMASANPIAGYFPREPHTIIQVLSPENSTHFSSENINLAFNLNLSLWYPDYLSTYNPSYSCYVSQIQYCLDGEVAGQIAANVSAKFSNFSVTLEVLDDGLHYLQVNTTTNGIHWAYEGRGYYDSAAPVLDSSDLIYFSIKAPPAFSNLSVENKTYSSTEVLLKFNVNEPTSWTGYSLDSQENMTIAANTTLADLAVGSHRLVLYANDTDGNMGKSDTIYFTINTQPSSTPSPTLTPTITSTQNLSPTITAITSPSSSSQQPTLSPTQTPIVLLTPMADNSFSNLLLIIGIVAVAVAVGAGIVIYFKKIRK